MEFRYNKSNRRLESTSKDVFVEVLPSGRSLDNLALHCHGKKIGFQKTTEFKHGPNYETNPDDYELIFRIEFIGTSIHGYRDGKYGLLVDNYRFKSRAEQDEVVQLITEALLQYDQVNQPPKRKISVYFRPELERRLESGGLIKK